jgi:hypothetical protein
VRLARPAFRAGPALRVIVATCWLLYFSVFQIMSATVRPAGMNGRTCSL